MKHITILAVLAAMTFFGTAQQASAQSVPNVMGLEQFSSQTKFLSLNGYLRWQYFTENNVWISSAEAGRLIKSQEIASK